MARLKGRSFAETRSGILDLIRSSGQISRIELAELSGLTEATISKVVRTLLDGGFIVELGPGKSTGGKRPTILGLNTSSVYAVGITLDRARISYVLCDLSGHAVDEMMADGIMDSRPTDMMARVSNDLEAFLDRHSLTREDIVGVGIAGAGRVRAPDGVLQLTRVGDAWEEFSIEAALHESSGLPVILENDANCAALGEFWSGRVPAGLDFAVVYIATGIGFGIVVNGAIYRGGTGNAGELGHVVLDVEGESCWCGSRGCLETLAAPAAVLRRALNDSALAIELGLSVQSDPGEAFARIGRAARNGNRRAEALILESARYLAIALVTVVNVFGFDKLFLGGPALAETSEFYLSTVRAMLADHAFTRATHPVEVDLTEVGPHAAALGAASVVLHSRLTPHRDDAQVQRMVYSA